VWYELRGHDVTQHEVSFAVLDLSAQFYAVLVILDEAHRQVVPQSELRG
jgi:hypothetical protein